MKHKVFFIPFKSLSIAKNDPRLESAPLLTLSNSWDGTILEIVNGFQMVIVFAKELHLRCFKESWIRLWLVSSSSSSSTTTTATTTATLTLPLSSEAVMEIERLHSIIYIKRFKTCCSDAMRSSVTIWDSIM